MAWCGADNFCVAIAKKCPDDGSECGRVMLFLDRTAEVRRSERMFESTAGIIPGNRGMEGGSWCRLPLAAGNCRGRHMSPVPRAGVMTGPSHDTGTVRRAAMRNRGEPSQAWGKFRIPGQRSYPVGIGCYCADRNAVAFPGGTTPPRGLSDRTEGAKGKRGSAGRTNPGKVRQRSSIGWCEKPRHPTAKPRQPER